MSRKFRILQIGMTSIEKEFLTRTEVYVDFLDSSLLVDTEYMDETLKALAGVKKSYDFIFIETTYTSNLMKILPPVIEPYNTYISGQFYNQQFKNDPILKKIYAMPIEGVSREAIIQKVKALSFTGQYGDKIKPSSFLANPSFNGNVTLIGNRWAKFDGDFGDTLTPIASSNELIYYEKNKGLEIWPEYKAEGQVEVEITYRMFQSGSVDELLEVYILSQNELQEPFLIKPRQEDAFISYSVKAKGKGSLFLGAVHRRWSRLEFGKFLLGGNIYADQERNEFIYYFYPGDMKPPLNVYFGGYRPAEGFEGFFMMKERKAPFILFGDPRIEGGAFYMGTAEYENAIKQVIFDKLQILGFEDNELILSGLSMGSFGALYYGVQLNPKAIIVGKPLVNAGTVANNMKVMRPEDFETSLDILLSMTGGTSASNVKELDERFWQKIKTSDVKNTTFAICYMEDDDYDLYAFNELMKVLSEQQAKVLSRGVPGRHNDDTPTIINWFVNFYDILLEDLFRRIN